MEQYSNGMHQTNAKWMDFNFVHFVQFCPFCPISSISSGVLDFLQKSGQNNNPGGNPSEKLTKIRKLKHSKEKKVIHVNIKYKEGEWLLHYIDAIFKPLFLIQIIFYYALHAEKGKSYICKQKHTLKFIKF